MKISVITVTKNNKNGLVCAIESVWCQSYHNIEHIIVDGSSTDGSVEILQQAKKSRKRTHNSLPIIDHYSLVTISEVDSGIYDALNKGIKIASGDVIGLLHSDDLFANEFVLSKAAEKFQQKSVDAVYGDLVYVRSSDINKVIRYWKSGEYNPKKMIYGWMPPHPALFVKKDIYLKYGLYDTSLKIASDYEMILRLFWKHKISTAYLPKIITKMRWGGASNKSFGNLLTKSKEDYIAMKKNGLPLPCFALALKNIRKIPQFIGNKYI
ncbi:MAG: glycosyltransferase [Bacteroidetes bacterium]|nr:glycosyltransferase [Bacteroidota bacterium]